MGRCQTSKICLYNTGFGGEAEAGLGRSMGRVWPFTTKVVSTFKILTIIVNVKQHRVCLMAKSTFLEIAEKTQHGLSLTCLL